MVTNKTNSNNLYNFEHTPHLVFDTSLKLENGSVLNKPTIAYQTYGELLFYLEQFYQMRLLSFEL